MDKQHTSTASRRGFLLAAGAGSVAAAAVMIGGAPSSRSTPAGNGNGSRGYRLTGHILNYYRTARI
jgi:hypothetical protein